jgi:hypothetical protein
MNRAFSAQPLPAVALLALSVQPTDAPGDGRNDLLHPLTPLKSGTASVAVAPPSHADDADTVVVDC